MPLFCFVCFSLSFVRKPLETLGLGHFPCLTPNKSYTYAGWKFFIYFLKCLFFGKTLENKGVRVTYIRAIKDMYEGSRLVWGHNGDTEDFPITTGLHQGSTLSPYLFTFVLDVLTEHIQERAPRCMLFADERVLLGESKEELNGRLETSLRNVWLSLS